MRPGAAEQADLQGSQASRDVGKVVAHGSALTSLNVSERCMARVLIPTCRGTAIS